MLSLSRHHRLQSVVECECNDATQEPLTGFDEKREVLLGAAARAFAHDRALARGAAHRAACVASTRPPFTSADLSAISGQARELPSSPHLNAEHVFHASHFPKSSSKDRKRQGFA
jgi:hypothetical protein